MNTYSGTSRAGICEVVEVLSGGPVFSPAISQGITAGLLCVDRSSIIHPKPPHAQNSFPLALVASIDDLRRYAPSLGLLISNPEYQDSGSGRCADSSPLGALERPLLATNSNRPVRGKGKNIAALKG